jgi:hypothetical protein
VFLFFQIRWFHGCNGSYVVITNGPTRPTYKFVVCECELKHGEEPEEEGFEK